MTLLALTSAGAEWSFIWMVTILGFCLVLLLLFVFVFIMKGLGFLMRDRSQDKPAAQPTTKNPANDAAAVATALHLSQADNDMAAVAMALHLYYGVHDVEAPKMTLTGHASAWNDKSFGLNNLTR